MGVVIGNGDCRSDEREGELTFLSGHWLDIADTIRVRLRKQRDRVTIGKGTHEI